VLLCIFTGHNSCCLPCPCWVSFPRLSSLLHTGRLHQLAPRRTTKHKRGDSLKSIDGHWYVRYYYSRNLSDCHCVVLALLSNFQGACASASTSICRNPDADHFTHLLAPPRHLSAIICSEHTACDRRPRRRWSPSGSLIDCYWLRCFAQHHKPTSEGITQLLCEGLRGSPLTLNAQKMSSSTTEERRPGVKGTILNPPSSRRDIH